MTLIFLIFTYFPNLKVGKDRFVFFTCFASLRSKALYTMLFGGRQSLPPVMFLPSSKSLVLIKTKIFNKKIEFIILKILIRIKALLSGLPAWKCHRSIFFPLRYRSLLIWSLICRCKPCWLKTYIVFLELLICKWITRTEKSHEMIWQRPLCHNKQYIWTGLSPP